MGLKRLIISCILLLIGHLPVLAKTPKIELNAILNNAVVARINGEQLMLQLNQPSAAGYRVVTIEEDHAVFVIHGERFKVRLGATIGSSKAAPVNRLVINKNSGMYYVSGYINQVGVNFLVDTGATLIAMNSITAERIGIDYKGTGVRSMANTASGTVAAWRIKLNTVNVGTISVQQVDAMVIEGAYPTAVLLGMSFLSQIKMQDTGTVLTLEQLY